MLHVTFCGAARTVTGSQYFLEYEAPDKSKFSFCIDSGMFQSGQQVNLFRINSHLLFDPRKLDAIVLTHAHLDHCGRIPYLVRHGFGGRIYSTPATKSIAEVVMMDAARISTDDKSNSTSQPLRGIKKSQVEDRLVKLEMDEEYLKILKTQTNVSENQGLYDEHDVEQAVSRFKTYEYREPFFIHPNLKVEFFDAGHILGSAYVIITEVSSGKQLAFSGDFGNVHKPIIEDPVMPGPIPNLTHIFVETTYGNRLHGKLDPKERLRKIISETVREGGQVLLPAFSVERAQEVIYFIVELMQENKLPHVPIFLDSPMASKVLQICLEHPELYDQAMRDKIANKANPLIYKSLKILESPQESKMLNNFDKPCIIIAGSGMLTGGRILKHLYFHVEDPKNTLLMVGYQANGTLGRQILEGVREIEIEGKTLAVATRIEVINEFSAHADQQTLKNWIVDMTQTRNGGEPATVFLMHGEKESSLGFGKEIDGALPQAVKSYWPHFGEKVALWS